jgi:hypothetical protein
VGELLGAVLVVVVDVVVAVSVVLVVVGSPVMVPITQYDWLVSRLGQLIPGFSCWRVSTDSPQLLAKLEQVAPASAVVEKSQSTARRDRAAAIPGTMPAMRMYVKYMLWTWAWLCGRRRWCVLRVCCGAT